MKNIPQVLHCEKNIISAALLEPDIVIPLLRANLIESDFVNHQCRIVFKHILKLANEKTTPDTTTLRESLKKDGQLSKEVVDLLFGAVNSEWTASYVGNYIELIKEKAHLRLIAKTCEKVAFEASKSIDGPEPFVEEIAKTLDYVKKRGVAPTEDNAFGSADFLKNHFRKEVSGIKEYAARKTGFENIDENQIFTPGLYVLGGLAAGGKTTFAWRLLNRFAKRGNPCIYCSYEMSALELYTKTVAAEVFQIDRDTTLTGTQILRGSTSRVLEEAIEKVGNEDIPLKVFEFRDETIDDLLRKLENYCAMERFNKYLEHCSVPPELKKLESEVFEPEESEAKKPKLRPPIVCIDYLQIIPHSKESAKAGIDDIVRKLKNFQRETNTTFIVISSFNRLNYLQTVSFESFKESGNIEYSADVVWGLQLDCMNNLPSKDINKARETIEQAKRANPRKIQLRCLKNRKGSNYDCYFDYYASHDYFEETIEPFEEGVRVPPNNNEHNSKVNDDPFPVEDVPTPLDDEDVFDEDYNVGSFKRLGK